MSNSGTTRRTPAGLSTRLASALRRRLRYAWSQLARRGRRPAAQAALEWLIRSHNGQGIPANSAESAGCPGVTGAAIETALAFGCRREARRWARWLVSIQRADGSMPDAKLPASSFYNTAQAVGGFLAIIDELPEVEHAARRACEYLRSWIDDNGHTRPPGEDHLPNAGDPMPHQLPCVAPLWKAGLLWSVFQWRSAAEQAVDFWASGQAAAYREDHSQAFAWTQSVADCVRHAEQYLELGRRVAAERIMQRVAKAQRADGSLPAGFDLERIRKPAPLAPLAGRGVGGERSSHTPLGAVLSAGVAHAALLWYRLGERDRADRALRYLERNQASHGGFPIRCGRLVPGHMRHRDAWTAKHYLDAALARVLAAFDTEGPIFPDSIDPEDGRVLAVREWRDTLPPDAHVADVGCGTGRYLRHLARWFSQGQWTGVDIFPAMLEWLPDGVTACPGNLLRIPAADGAFDGAFAVESLEHSLVPQRAIAEICRVVRPGGRVLVIDKHRAQQPLSEHEPWERWFLPEELTGWLARYCEGVTVQPVSHSEGRPGHDLFLAAAGTRRMQG